MKRIKKLWENNKIVIVLCTILVICFACICFVALTYFFGGSDSTYGSRLNGIEDYEITSKDEEKIISSIKESEEVDNVTMSINGKVIYINIYFESEVTLSVAQTLAGESLEFIGEDNQTFYDINYSITGDDYILMGYKNTENTKIEWNNNLEVEEEFEDTEESEE